MASAIEPNMTLFNQKRLSLEVKVNSYNGPDPLKLYYDFVVSIDEIFGKNNVLNDLVPLLEEVIGKYRADTKYTQDQRFIQLLIIYVDTKENKAELYQDIHKLGIGTECAIFYKAWADELTKQCDYVGAFKVYNMGLKAQAKPLESLKNYHHDFISDITPQIIEGLSLLSEKSKKEPKRHPAQPTEVKNWELNACSADDLELNVPIAYFEPPDPSKRCMYRKDLVYRDENTEYCTEEIMADFYYKKIEALKPILADRDINSPVAKKPLLEHNLVVEAGHLEKSKTPSEITKQPFRPVVPHLFKKANEQDSSLLNHQSFTVNTKEAMNVVQEMWSSPTPSNSQPKISESITEQFKVPEVPKAQFQIFNESAAAVVQKPQSIPIFTDSSSDDLNKSEEEVLAEKLKDTSLHSRPLMLNVPAEDKEKDDFTDITCNTKAFDFVLPSSTPFSGHSRRPANYIPNNDGSYIAEESPAPTKTQQELSMILEASKERYSSSIGSSNNSFQPGALKTPAPIRYDVGHIIEKGVPIDPFSPNLIDSLLHAVKFPYPHYANNLHIVNSNVPSCGKNMKLGNNVYSIFGELGKGAYARVMKASFGNKVCALKVEKPACKWEYYITKEIQRRVPANAAALFMDISNAYIFQNGSIMETEWAKYGTLLNVVNKCNTMYKGVGLVASIHFSIEIIEILEYLHKCNIIHGDIKPDNFVVRSLPSLDETYGCLQLIDFGRSIDMSLFPEDTTFDVVVTTEGFQCNEMKENRPWTYQTDLYGLAGCIHCVLVGDYMKVTKQKGIWVLSKPLQRSVKRDIWDPIFHTLLNIESCKAIPKLSVLKAKLSDAIKSMNKDTVLASFSSLSNTVHGK